MKKLKFILAASLGLLVLSGPSHANDFHLKDVSAFWRNGSFSGFKNELDLLLQYAQSHINNKEDVKSLINAILSILTVDKSFTKSEDPNFALRGSGPTDEELAQFIRALYKVVTLDDLYAYRYFNNLKRGRFLWAIPKNIMQREWNRKLYQRVTNVNINDALSENPSFATPIMKHNDMLSLLHEMIRSNQKDPFTQLQPYVCDKFKAEYSEKNYPAELFPGLVQKLHSFIDRFARIVTAK